MAQSTALPDRWDRAVRTPLLVFGGIFFVGMTMIAFGPDLPPLVQLLALLGIVLSWLAFAVDYIVHVWLAPRGHRLAWVLHHPLQLLAVAIPPFRAVRVIDLVRQLPGFAPHSGTAVRVQIVGSAFAYAAVFVYFIALSTLLVERDAPGATITSFWDSMWWAVVTLTTVGYGDMVPVTVLGRCYAVLLMLGGIVIIGVASGTAVSLISERIRKAPVPDAPAPEAPQGAAPRRAGTARSQSVRSRPVRQRARRSRALRRPVPARG
ncbi:MAG TPA: ion channel [Microbacteriaceae bacterium]|nr:ion channel [Microbacteriaceae bacterium]